jgi:hypothetical protein
MAKIPYGVYGANRDGLLDPNKASVEDRRTKATTRLTEERTDGEFLSPWVAALRAAADRALTSPPARPAPKPKKVFVATRDEARKG